MPSFISCKLQCLNVCAVSLVLAGCATNPLSSGTKVTLKATQGNTANGELMVSQVSGDVRLQGQIRGLKPGAEQGFHVHEKGDCSAPDASSAGGHFNPDGQSHGLMNHDMHHAGDLPALRADAQGVARVDVIIPGLTLTSDSHGILGKALVIHRDADDGRTQPTGNSGPRVSCGVIPIQSM